MGLRHENLVVWQRADEFFIEIHRVVRTRFPLDERFELSRQLRRAAYSIVANIVEGMARRSMADRAHLLNIAAGSLSEAGYCLHAAHRLGYLTASEHSRLHEQLMMVGGPLGGLLRAVRQQGQKRREGRERRERRTGQERQERQEGQEGFEG